MKLCTVNVLAPLPVSGADEGSAAELAVGAADEAAGAELAGAEVVGVAGVVLSPLSLPDPLPEPAP